MATGTDPKVYNLSKETFSGFLHRNLPFSKYRLTANFLKQAIKPLINKRR